MMGAGEATALGYGVKVAGWWAKDVRVCLEQLLEDFLTMFELHQRWLKTFYGQKDFVLEVFIDDGS